MATRVGASSRTPGGAPKSAPANTPGASPAVDPAANPTIGSDLAAPCAASLTSTSAGVYRPEIHGLRALAIGMVAVYHVWFGRVSGGIDIFLLISSFLLMQTFLRRIDNARPLDLIGYWLKAFRRLIVPAVVTILGTLLLVYLFFPRSQLREIFRQTIASALYYENWYLALNSANYYADKLTVSPLQHFWSLSMQGQVFLVWPALIAVCVLIAARTARNPRPILWGVFATIFAASLAWSIYRTATDQTFAYFSTLTRLWEFALGALLALGLPLIESRRTLSKAGRLARVAMGWIGVVLILACGLILDVEGVFPGVAALWPTLSAVMVIVAGATGSRLGVDQILGCRLLARLADCSYCLYLAHWPILIACFHIFNTNALSFLQGVFVLAASLMVAVYMSERVDAPVRYSTWLQSRYWRSAVVIVLALAAGIVPSLVSVAHINRVRAQFEAEADRNNPGAAVLYQPDLPEANPLAPALPFVQDLGAEWVSLPRPCSERFSGADAYLARDMEQICQMADTDYVNNVMVLGNSRMEQYMGALIPLAETYRWQMMSFLTGGCTFALQTSSSAMDPDCVEQNSRIMDFVLEQRPQIVVLETTFVDMRRRERLILGIDEVIERLTSRGITVIGFRDMPRLAFEPLDCYEGLAEGEDCLMRRDEVYVGPDPSQRLIDDGVGNGRLYLMDLTDLICPDEFCPLETGNVRVYLDRFHITTLYARSMAQAVSQRLDEQGFTLG